MEKEKIIKTISIHLPLIKDKYHIKKIGIFGSTARDGATKKSDIDILVEFQSPTGFFGFIRLENYLSQILDQKVDLISKKALKPAIKNGVLKEVVYV